MNRNNYCTEKEYKKGYVLFIDILGFSKISESNNNFELIKKCINNIKSVQRTLELNNLSKNISIASDSIIITLDTQGKEDEQTWLFSILSYAAFIRSLVIKYLKTEIRAVLTYGYYMHCGSKNDIYFGPAITRAVKLEKQKDEEIESPLLKDNPASILIDNMLIKSKDLKNMIQCTNLTNKEFVCIGNDFYIYNPFYKTFDLEQLVKGTDIKTYIEECKNFLTSKDELPLNIRSKYSLDKYLLDKFIDNSLINTN